jgi:hypothetical protein
VGEEAVKGGDCWVVRYFGVIWHWVC